MDGQEFETTAVEDVLLRTCRYGKFEYRFDAANGDYDVTLIMGEPFFRDQGQRVFSVELEGKPVIQDLDLIKEAGFGKPFKKTVRASVRNGQLSLKFSASVNEALLSAIEVKAVSDGK